MFLQEWPRGFRANLRHGSAGKGAGILPAPCAPPVGCARPNRRTPLKPNKTVLSLATVLALGLTAQATAHDSRHCVDDACTVQALFAPDRAAGGEGAIVAQRFGNWGIDTAGMDTGVRPGDDFFAFASGTWAATTQIPSDQSSYGAFRVLRDLSEARVRALVESYPKGDPSTGDAAKIATLYQGFMDETAVETLGAAPLQPFLGELKATADKAALASLIATRGGFGGGMFSLFVSDDQRNPDQYTLYMGQSGLGLGDREMYLRDNFAPQRERYQAYVAQLLELAGWDDPAGNAEAILALETRIADAHWTRAESRDRDKTYNP
jgi:putative endopeptidase